MKKPAFDPARLGKNRILWDKTFHKLHQLFKDPAPLRPAAVPDELRAALGIRLPKRPLPQLKGNVYHTMKEILHIFIHEWNQATRPINLAIRTNRTALAKRCGNRDPQTAYFHVLALIEAGFLRGKVRLGHGLQLLLPPGLLVFDGPAPVVPLLSIPGRYVAAAAAAPAPEPAAFAEHLAALAAALRAKFST